MVEGRQNSRGLRRGLELRDEIMTLRMTGTGRAEIRDLAARERRTEADMVRLLLSEALAERARTARR